MSHPDPNAAPDLTPIKVGEVFENPVTGEVAKILELPWTNPEGRGVAELTALVGARVVGEHRHPATIERFTVLEGELTVKLDGEIGILPAGETAVVPNSVSIMRAKRSPRRDLHPHQRVPVARVPPVVPYVGLSDRRRSPCHARVPGAQRVDSAGRRHLQQRRRGLIS